MNDAVLEMKRSQGGGNVGERREGLEIKRSGGGTKFRSCGAVRTNHKTVLGVVSGSKPIQRYIQQFHCGRVDYLESYGYVTLYVPSLHV
jgi:hypothetical protein